MTPAEYVDQIVVPTVRELREDRRSRRRAYLACITVFHIKDHLAIAGETGIEGAMRNQCSPGFDVVRGVCNGTKHVQTNSGHPIPFAAGDDQDRPPAILGQMVLSRSILGDSKGGRDIGKGSNRVDLYQSAKAVLGAFQTLYPQHLGTCDISDC